VGEVKNDVLERLRGIYRVPVNDGAGPLNGSHEYVRQFDTSKLPPIHGEAATEIESLRRLLAYAVARTRFHEALPGAHKWTADADNLAAYAALTPPERERFERLMRGDDNG
jgi:hypothetical protein